MLDSPLLEPAASTLAEAPRLLLASPADVPFIVETIAEESRVGHFSCDCDQPGVLDGLWQQVRSAVTDGVMPLPGERHGAGARAFVVQMGQVNAGFAILVEHRPGSWGQRLELFALSVRLGFRGRGLGRHLVTRLVRDSRSASLYARCAYASVGMAAVLKSCGFELGGESTPRTMTLELRRVQVSD